MPRHKNVHNRSSASYDSRYDENEHHSNSEDQEEDLDDGDGSESEEFNNLFDLPNDVLKERKGTCLSRRCARRCARYCCGASLVEDFMK